MEHKVAGTLLAASCTLKAIDRLTANKAIDSHQGVKLAVFAELPTPDSLALEGSSRNK